MKILRIIARLNVGGPARHVVWLTSALQDKEFNSLLITGVVPHGEDDMSYFATQHHVEPVVIPQMSRELSLKDAVTLWKIFRLLLKEKPDIIHTHTAKAGTIGRVAGFFYRWLTPKTLIGKPRNVCLIHTFHGHVFHSYYGPAKTKTFITIERILARFATDKIIVLSEQQRREIHLDFKVGKVNQFVIVPLGINLEIFQDRSTKRNKLRHEIEASDDEILVGIVGRLTEIKNHSLFLRVAHCLKGLMRNHKRVRFLIIGDGQLREKLEDEMRRLNLSNDVLFLGDRNDPETFYPALDIVALTSLNEGTPLTLIEAMANSRPVISTCVGGVVDLLGEKKVENVNGFTVCERGLCAPSNNVEALSSGLLHLIEEEALRLELGGRGEQFVKKIYSKARLVDDVKKLYRQLTAGS